MPAETPFLDGAGLAPHLFIVRIWYEPSRHAAKQWRGSVEHIPSGQRLYFASLGNLTDFITLRLNNQSQPSPEGE